ncbi:MAG: ABC transporter permease [Streptosporangiaceae bacterium]
MSSTMQHSAAGMDAAAEPAPGSRASALLGGSRAIFLRQREASIFVIAVGLVVYFGLTTPGFFARLNLADICYGTAAFAIVAIGEVMLLTCGEIDLSVGFVWTLSPFLMYFLIQYDHVPVILAFVLALASGALIGFVNGFITVRLKVASFITTLGTSFVIYGFMLTVSHAQQLSLAPKSLATGRWLGGATWSEISWAVALVLIFHIVLTRTRWGLHTIAAGGNLLGATEAGINVARIKIGNFMITGTLGALAGILESFRVGTIDPSAGQFAVMFSAVSAAVIGGTALAGGSGTVFGAFLGMLVLAILGDGFNLRGISTNPFQIILGLAIILAMVANVYLTRLRRAGES